MLPPDNEQISLSELKLAMIDHATFEFVQNSEYASLPDSVSRRVYEAVQKMYGRDRITRTDMGKAIVAFSDIVERCFPIALECGREIINTDDFAIAFKSIKTLWPYGIKEAEG
jgi:hypothetical protein